MAAVEPAQERMERHLREAIAHSDPDSAAFWADAIKSWERPIPDYARSELNQFSLKQRAGANTSEATRNRGLHGSIFAPKKGGARGSSGH